MKNATGPTVMTSLEYRQFIEELKARVISPASRRRGL